MACAIVTFVLTVVIVAGHFHPVTSAIFVGTKVEGVVTIVLVVFWTAIVAVNTDAGKGVAPNGTDADAVENGNLYYFSWAGFITSIVLLVSFLRDAFGVDVAGTVNRRTDRLQWWAALLAASIIVMGSAAQVHSSDCQADRDNGESDSYCRKTKWAIAAGTLSMAFCALVISTKVFKYTATAAATPFMLEVGVSFFLTIFNAFAVGYTTSADAPGSSIGNLYYFSWAMFLLAVVLASECYSEFNRSPTGDGGDEGGANGTTSNGGEYNVDRRGDIEVETFDDNI